MTVWRLRSRLGNSPTITVMGNGMLLNRDGKTPTESEDKAALAIEKSYGKPVSGDPKNFCLRRLADLQNNYELISKEYPRKTTLGGHEAYELIAIDADDETKEICMTILFEEDGGYYIFLGIYQVGAKQAKTDIKAVMETFSKRH